MAALVTKLKEEYTDNNLPKIDEIQVHVVNDTPNEIMGVVIFSIIADGSYARTTGDISLCNEGGTENYGEYKELSTGTQNIYFKGTAGSVFIGKKGNLGGIALSSEKTKVDISDLNYMSYNRINIYGISSGGHNSIIGDASEFLLVNDIYSELNVSYCTSLDGDISDVLKQGKSINILSLNFSSVKMDLQALSYQNSIYVSTYCDGVYGDIKYAVYNKKKVSGTQNIEFNISGGSFLNIHGSIEELVSLGVSLMGAGSIRLYSLKNMPNVTYQGVSVAESSTIPSESPLLSWDAQGNISWS